MDKTAETKKKEKIRPIECIWAILCSLSSTDQETHNISLFNIVEQFNIPPQAFSQQLKEKKPLISPLQYEIVLFWRRTLNIGISDEEIFADLKIKTIDPSGVGIQETISPFKFPKGLQRLRFRVIMPGLIFTTKGDYVHQISLKLSEQNDFKSVIEVPFEVKEAILKPKV